MDRFSDKDMKDIQDSIRDKVMGMGYDFSNIFFDASNMYTFMEENDMAKKGHNKNKVAILSGTLECVIWHSISSVPTLINILDCK